MSDDKENTAFFSDGMHEDILTNLANFPGLRVVSRTSVMQYRDTDTRPPMREIAAKLNVAYIIEGSVRGRGGKVRVTVQLIDARTDGHVWAQTYDRDPSDIFATQTELAGQIAAELKTRLAQR
jgi:TolB-like protein